MEADPKEAEGQGRCDLQAAQEEDQEEGQEEGQKAAQKQETVHKTGSAQTVPAQRESEMGSRSPQTACSRLHLEVCQLQGISEGLEASKSPLDPEMESAAASQEPDEKNRYPEMQMEAWALSVGE